MLEKPNVERKTTSFEKEKQSLKIDVSLVLLCIGLVSECCNAIEAKTQPSSQDPIVFILFLVHP